MSVVTEQELADYQSDLPFLSLLFTLIVHCTTPLVDDTSLNTMAQLKTLHTMLDSTKVSSISSGTDSRTGANLVEKGYHFTVLK